VSDRLHITVVWGDSGGEDRLPTVVWDIGLVTQVRGLCRSERDIGLPSFLRQQWPGMPGTWVDCVVGDRLPTVVWDMGFVIQVRG
jgi:hypothetical protein